MTNKQFENRLKSLLPDLQDYIIEQATQLFESGCIDTENYDNDYQLPKMMLCIVLENAVDQYLPISEQASKAMKNIRKF